MELLIDLNCSSYEMAESAKKLVSLTFNLCDNHSILVTKSCFVLRDRVQNTYISFSLQKFANLVCLIDEVDKAITKLRQFHEEYAERMIHIGGGYFISLANGSECLNIIKCYYGHLDATFQPSGVGVKIPFPAWWKLKGHTKAIYDYREDVAAIAPCHACVNQDDPKGLCCVCYILKNLLNVAKAIAENSFTSIR